MSQLLTSILMPVFNNINIMATSVQYITQFTEAPYEIILIDNGSWEPQTNETYEALSQDSRIKVIRNEQNLGFGRANNIGLQQAQGTHIALINTDMFPVAPWLNHVYQRFDQTEKCGAVQGLIVLPDEEKGFDQWTVQTCGSQFNQQGEAIYHLPNLAMDDPRVHQACALQSFMGTGVVLDRKAIEEVGFFDEEYDIVFMEDTDLSLRMSAAGYHIHYEPAARFVHLHSASMPHLDQETYDRSRHFNKALFHKKWPVEKVDSILKQQGFSGLLA
ncbi:glycosyltransferase family 2 protein [Magnetococcus sp. PR-3]|uniref:glycosyltransferase family 2 protein n=1 Tax=Magnetococcus sp. PR-3 TaxID=3120355 RepID=UPI002FCDE5E6